MTKLRIPYIQHFVDRHGRPRFYFRKNGCKRVALPGLPGSAEFMEAYQAALTHMCSGGASRLKPGSISEIVILYRRSPAYQRLARSTQDNHRNISERIRERHGDKLVSTIHGRHIRALIMEHEATPAKANHELNVWRHLMRLAVRRGLRVDDPTEGIKKLRYKASEISTWEPADIEAYKRRWPIGTRAHLAMSLLLLTAQRKSDVVRLGPQHIEDNTLHFVQQKTNQEMWIPILPALWEVLRQTELGSNSFLVTAHGKPMSPAGFSNWFRECVEAAGLPSGLSPHGLRKAACVALAELGCTPHEIMAISGHESLAEVERYTRKVNRKRMGESAMTKWASAKPKT